MNVDLASLHKILKDPTRRKIVQYLSSKGQLTYMELMNLLEITNTGKFNYHLKILADLIQKEDDGRYSLTERGQLASQLLQKFPEKTIEAKSLAMADALLIGIVGFLLLFSFPLIYFPVAGFAVSAFLVTIYEFIVPGTVMWWLTVRRAKSHDFYDLFKPPLIPMALVICGIVLMALTRTSFSITWYSSSGSSVQLGMMGVSSFLVMGFVPFIGIIIAESVHRLSKRM
jgi:hypothetical protein